jgi:mannose-6-phosphate isomerase class I
LQSTDQQSDPHIFLKALDYKTSVSKNLELKHTKWEKSTRGATHFYKAPMDEFDLLNIRLGTIGGAGGGSGEEEVVKEGIQGPSVFVVNEGRVVFSTVEGQHEEDLPTGHVVFIKPKTAWKVRAVDGGKADVWGAFVEA